MNTSTTSAGLASNSCQERQITTDVVLTRQNNLNERLSIIAVRFKDLRQRMVGNYPENPSKDAPRPLASGFFSAIEEKQTTTGEIVEFIEEHLRALENNM